MRLERPKGNGLLALFLAVVGACAPAADSAAETPVPIIGGPCEGCEEVFLGLPESLSSSARIAPEDEAGAPLRIDGRVTRSDGSPATGVIVYAYHTDARGIYPRPKSSPGRTAPRHGRLRAWVETDDDGRYRFDTIRPASYPDARVPAHVHMHVLEPGCCTYTIDDIEFVGDPHLPEDTSAREARARGGSGLVEAERDADGSWRVTRDIVLGHEIRGYPGNDGG